MSNLTGVRSSHGPESHLQNLDTLLEQWAGQGVEFVRVSYSDMHGYPRGKDLPLQDLAAVLSKGVAFCAANLVDGLAGNPLQAPGTAAEKGYPDMYALPDLDTGVRIPWEPDTVEFLADLYDAALQPMETSPRVLLKKTLDLYRSLQLKPIVGHELEFFLLKKTDHGWERYSDYPSMVYTVGRRSDQLSVVHQIFQAGKALGLGINGGNHEFCRGQFEVNMTEGETLESTDRAFRFKNMVKEIAGLNGLLATFMGKPFNDEGGSGYHLHISLFNDDNQNVLSEGAGAKRLSELGRHFLGGILYHAPALTALCAPTINAYKRLVAGGLAPVAINWAYENRTTFVRVLGHDSSLRFEVRGGDGAANPYLLSAACLLAGYDGIQKRIEPPEPEQGAASNSDGRLPRSLREALDALREDREFCTLVGSGFIDAFSAMKAEEVVRFEAYVTEWEFSEYAYHL